MISMPVPGLNSFLANKISKTLPPARAIESGLDLRDDIITMITKKEKKKEIILKRLFSENPLPISILLLFLQNAIKS
jgi:hypothetical protein